MLARMGLALQLEPRPIGTKGLRDLNDLIAARRALVKDRTAAKNRAKGIGLAILRRQNADRLKRIGTDINAVDAAIAELIAADETLSAQHAILLSIPGISTVTAAALMARMPELGALDAVALRRPLPGCVVHTDRGSRYASETHRALLAAYGLVGSMSRRRNPYDNAKAESFMKTLKVEVIYLAEYETYDDVAVDLPASLTRSITRRDYIPPRAISAPSSPRTATPVPLSKPTPDPVQRQGRTSTRWSKLTASGSKNSLRMTDTQNCNQSRHHIDRRLISVSVGRSARITPMALSTRRKPRSTLRPVARSWLAMPLPIALNSDCRIAPDCNCA